MNVLEIRNLHKRFGDHTVLDGLNLSVPEGSVFGFLGQNGAGKTTTMKIVLGLLRADSGDISVCSQPVHYGATATNAFLGYLPDVPEFYGYLNPTEYLSLCGEITGLSRAQCRERTDELLRTVGLDEAKKKRISGFSRGMKQRLGIAQALIHRPRLLICDEPTSALDPVGRREILDLLLAVRGQTTVIFSTHILSDVERICDRAAILNNGQLALEGTLDELRQSRHPDRLLIEFAHAADAQQLLDALTPSPLIADAQCEGAHLTLQSAQIEELQRQLFARFAAGGCPLRVELLEPTLENLFMEAVQ